MAAEDDGVAGRHEAAGVSAFLGPGIRAVAEEDPPPVLGAVVREDGTVDHHEGVAGVPGRVEQLFDLLYRSFPEVDDEVRVRTAVEKEVGVVDIDPQFLAHAGGHIVHVSLRDDGVVVAAQVMVAGHGDQGEIHGQIGLEQAHGIVQEAGVDVGGGGVALDQVAHLEHEAGVVVHQAGGAVHQRGAALGPHLAVADELLAVVGLPFGIRVRVTGVVYFRVHHVIVGVSQDDHRILVLRLRSVLGKDFGRPAQQRRAQRRTGGILEKISPFHRLANVPPTKLGIVS